MNYAHPWVVSPDWLRDSTSAACRDAWRQVAPGVLVLEPRIGDLSVLREIPLDIATRIYRPVYWWYDVLIPGGTGVVRHFEDYPRDDEQLPQAYWVLPGRIPPEERVRFPRVAEEMNLKEAESAMELLELYRWRTDRYVVRDRGWCEEV